jgi:hypothetical protein
MRIHRANIQVLGSETGFGRHPRTSGRMGVAKIELPGSWAGVAEPLRALMAARWL